MRIENKKRFITFLVVCAIIIAALFNIVFAKENTEKIYETHVVQTGETLWSIARDNCNENDDIRNYVEEIKQINNIDSNLKVGQEIQIKKEY